MHMPGIPFMTSFICCFHVFADETLKRMYLAALQERLVISFASYMLRCVHMDQTWKKKWSI